MSLPESPEAAAPVDRVFQVLLDRYGPPRAGAEDAFPVLIATILSHRTNDDVTLPAADRLLATYPDVDALAQADPDHVRELIDGVGFHNKKAKAVIRTSQHLIDHHGGQVPREEEALLEVPWVGRKTMNCVKVYAFGEPVVAVDTHVHRIANRFGWAATETPEATEKILDDLLTPDQQLAVNELLVRFGREICRPVGPMCGDCQLAPLCPSARDRAPEGLGKPEGETMLSQVAAGGTQR